MKPSPTHLESGVLFLFHLESAAGYAMTPFERMFSWCGLQMTGGDPSRVHFGYTSITKGKSLGIDDRISNLMQCDFSKKSDSTELNALLNYVRTHTISTLVGVDFGPLHPWVPALRKAGVRRILSYWGAPVSGVGSGIVQKIKTVLKRVECLIKRYQWVDRAIFESQAMADSAVIGRGFAADRCGVVFLGVDSNHFRPARDLAEHTYAARELGLTPDTRVIIYAGHMEHRKGVWCLVDAAIELLTQNGNRYANVCFLICGNRPGEATHWEERIAKLNLSQQIRFGGYRKDLPALHRSSYCGVIASTGWDSFTYGAVEMTASGLPVIASRLQGLNESVLEGKTGLHFEPGNPKELRNCLERLLNDRSLRDTLSIQARARVEQELNLDYQYKHLLQEFLT